MKLSSPKDVGSLRLKVAEPCNWSCGFCHNEGDRLATTLAWDGELAGVLQRLKERFSIDTIHLTGGEPTLNPHIVSIIEGIKAMGLEAKMTTNGQFNEALREKIAYSGIDSISFSLHSLEPDDLLQIMDRTKSKEWAQEQIDRSTRNIIALKQAGVRLKLNTVISSEDDIPRVQDVFWWSARNDVDMRILDNLSAKDKSRLGIEKFIEIMQARKTGEVSKKGTSSTRYSYTIEGVGNFTVKRIDEVFLDGVCQKCPHFNKPSCQEGFYNIRLQRMREGWTVILCIQEQNQETVLGLDDFVALYG